MPAQPTNRSLSRRTALAGLGATGLALAADRAAVAQDTAPETTMHPIVGTWSVEFEPAQPAQLFVIVTFHADGSSVWSHPFGGIGIGVWTAADDRTVDSMNRYQNIADTPGEYVPGTVTAWSSFTLDETNEVLTERAVVEVRASDGTVLARFPYEPANPYTRMTVEPAPPLETPEATPAN